MRQFCIVIVAAATDAVLLALSIICCYLITSRYFSWLGLIYDSRLKHFALILFKLQLTIETTTKTKATIQFGLFKWQLQHMSPRSLSLDERKEEAAS